MNKTIKIIGEQQRQSAMEYIADLPLSPVHHVIIKPAEMSRSVSQNSLYWVFLTHLEKHSETGYIKDEFHEMYKGKHLVRIYIKKPDKHPILVSNIEEIEKVMQAGLNDVAKKLWNNTLKQLSTKEADVDEFREYLECIEAEMRDLNCVLPVKDDTYKRAMEK